MTDLIEGVRMTSALDGLQLRHWQTRQREDSVLLLLIDRENSRVNTLSQAVLEELQQVLERLHIEPPKALVIASNKDSGFIAGADIKEFQEFDKTGQTDDAIARGQKVFDQLARLPCPTVAAIDGFCMGGGTELSLACDMRIASDAEHTKIALPEIKLGIFPGWGGSVRLPRLIGAPAAMDMMLTGRNISAKAARAMGLVDKLVAAAVLQDEAAKLALTGVQRPLKQRLNAWLTTRTLVRRALTPMLRKQVARKARREHYPAPYALIENYRRAAGSHEKQLAAERKAVTKLAQSPTARNLVRVYFLQERLKSLASTAHDIQHVHVIGAGVMGGDIAAYAASKGFDVSLQDREQGAIDAALQRAQTLFEKRIKDPQKRSQASARLHGDSQGAQLGKADLVIEAIVENAAIKKELYAQITPQMQANALLTSNTSSIPLQTLSADLAHPERFAGLHYFNPVALMPLVEIVRHQQMQMTVQERLAAFCKALGKLPVPVAGTPGFLVNRVLFPYMLEAVTAHEEGIHPVLIDKAALAFGMPMGPIELLDTVGLDVANSVGAELAPFLNLPIPPALQTPPEAGKRGKKDGQGIYRWQQGKAIKPPLDGNTKMPDDLQDRLILPMVNQAVACLHEGVVDDADLLDAGVIFGTGFAPFRGGPIEYVRQTGVDAVLARLMQLQQRYGARFAPAAGWDNPALRS